MTRRAALRAIGSLSASVTGLTVLGGCQFASAPASTPTRVRRIGFLHSGSGASIQPNLDAFVDRLRQLGWVQGDNLSIEWRFGDGRELRLAPEMAADLVRLHVEVIVAVAPVTPPDHTIPVVMVNGPPPNVSSVLGVDLYQSLARPGGNVTGTVSTIDVWPIKAVEILKTVLPHVSRLAYVDDRTDLVYPYFVAALEQTAQTLGIHLFDLDVRTVEDVDTAFRTANAWGAEALLPYPKPAYSAGVLQRISGLAAQHHLPVLYGMPWVVSDSGGLMSYGQSFPASFQHGAEYVDRILRGARPADLPITEPRDWEFVVNVQTARALGITFPPDAAAQVTRWISNAP